MIRRITVIALLLLLSSAAVRAQDDVPTLHRHCTDLAGVLSKSESDEIDRYLAGYEQQSGNQFLVLIVQSTGDRGLEDYSLAVAEKNGIGRKGKDNGLLFLVAVQDRKMRFEVGYGLEPVLTDALTGLIIREVVAPQFRNGDYGRGIMQGMQAAVKAASGELTVQPARERREKKKGGNIVGLIIFLVILFFIFRGGRGGRGGGIWFIGPFGGFGGGGGGFGGGGGGFGGGFGGFSGGGGGFGGGGSSGSW